MSYEWQAFEPSASSAEMISGRDPRQFPWGYYARDDCGLASGSSFCWFSSVDELLAFLVEVEPLIYLDPEPEDEEDNDQLADIRNALRTVCDEYRGQPDLPPEFIGKINGVLAGLSSLQWAGKLADLSNGRGSEFARETLEAFREDEGVDIHAPVTEGELDAFVQRLSDFCH